MPSAICCSTCTGKAARLTRIKPSCNRGTVHNPRENSPMSEHEHPDMHAIVGDHDLLLITLDTLRFDAAQRCFERGELPVLSAYLPASGWERRHTPGSFTYAAHAAFFAGFLPTPARPGPHPRLFALDFEGSETTAPGTYVFRDRADIVSGLRDAGYHTICIGGVGFFNKRNPLGSQFP